MKVIIPEYISEIIDSLAHAGFTAYAVGGAVRDALLGVEAHDWDLASDASPTHVAEALKPMRTLPTGAAHGTVTALSRGGPVEITSFRTEVGYSDGRRPDSVCFVSSLNEDLSRRDFTVNAMAAGTDGALIDPFGGQADLAAGLIRCVGEPALRFTEDHLRILRALRFASRLDFQIEPATAVAMSRCSSSLSKISVERVLTELRGILRGVACGRILLSYPDVIADALPELSTEDVCSAGDIISRMDCDEISRLAVLLTERADPILRRLHCDRATIAQVCLISGRLGDTPSFDAYSARKLISEIGCQAALRLAAIQLAAAVPGADSAAAQLERISETEERITVDSLDIDGEELRALGVPSGKAVGIAKRELLNAVLCGHIPNEHDALFDFLRSMNKF